MKRATDWLEFVIKCIVCVTVMMPAMAVGMAVQAARYGYAGGKTLCPKPE